MKIAMFADADPNIGTGHVMRLMALAISAQKIGLDSHLYSRLNVQWLHEWLIKEKQKFTVFDEAIPTSEKPSTLLNKLSSIEADLVILDGYHFNLACQQAVMAAGYKLLIVDDYNHLQKYQADILLNHNFGAQTLNYRGNIGQKLLGPNYALLRPEFADVRAKVKQRVLSKKIKNILLTMGGGEFSEHIEKLATDLAITELSGCTLRIIAGKTNSVQIMNALKTCPAQVEILSHIADMTQQILWADLVISAGGGTCLELCCLGTPFLVHEIAANQKVLINYLSTNKIAPVFSKAALVDIFKYNSRHKIHKNIFNLVDGCGAKRVLDSLKNKKN